MALFLILSLAIVVPGLLVIANQRNQYKEWVFLALSIFLGIWVFSNFMVDNDPDRALFWTRTTFFSVIWASYFFLEFTLNFPTKTSVSITKRYIVFAVSAIVALVVYSPIFISGVYNDNSIILFTPGPLYELFIVYYILVIVGAFIILIRSLIKSKGLNRSRLKVVLLALSAMTIVTTTTNLILPELFNYSKLTPYGGYATIIFTVGISYAMLRHQLFDLRSAVARTLAYVFSIGIVVASYSIIAFILSDFLTSNSYESQTSQRIVIIIFVAFVALLFQPIKVFFDKITNKIFFRDAYEPQNLIDRLNQTLVTNVNLDELLTKSALVIQEEMKASFCTFYIRETSYFPSRILGAHRSNKEFDEIEDVEKYASKIHTKVFSVEFKTGKDDDKKLATALKKYDVEVMARLTNTLDFEVKGIGYIFMGSKKSGSPYSTNDLKILEIIANELVIAIENVLRFEEIEQFNVTLQKKIDDATKELKQTNEKLRALDEAKDEFVSMASHQLRTPLTSIKGYISMVLEGDAGKITETQKTMLGQAFFSSQRMVYLISDLLNVSRLKTGKFVIESKPVYLPDVVESEINQLQDGATAKNLTLTFTKPKEFATMNLDEMKLRQVIMNFTDNAIYYTPSGGKISIELKETPKTVEFSVKDSGIGVPKDQQHKLFTKFYRADNARKARPDGTGLGLFMAKKVIIAQGGSMIFESKENKGSTFGFSFPKEKLLVAETIQPQPK